MRIAYLSLNPQFSRQHASGYAVNMEMMIRAFRAAGHEVHPIIPGEHDGAGRGGAELRTGATFLKRCVPSLAWETGRDLRRLRGQRRIRDICLRQLRDFRPDVIYERVAPLCDAGVRAAKVLEIPRMAEVHAPLIEERCRGGRRTLLAGVAERMETRNLRSAQCIRVVSSPLKQHLCDRGISADRIVVQPNGVDIERFSRPPNSAVRESLGLSGRFVFGYVGSFLRWHRVDAILRAFAAIRDDCPGSGLLIVGDGEARDELRTLARELQLTGAVVFTGSVSHDRIPELYPAIDVACLAGCNWYASPLKLFEYGAARRPVIAPMTQPVLDVVTPERDALLVPNGDIPALVAALRRLYIDSSLCHSLAESLHRKVVADHSSSAVAATILGHLQRIAAAVRHA